MTSLAFLMLNSAFWSLRLLPMLMLSLVLPVSQANMDVPQSREVAELYDGMARFEANQEHYYSAMVRLLANQKQFPQHNERQDALLLLAEMTVSYGLYDQAEAVLRALRKNPVNTIMQDRVWFTLGKLYYHKELFEQAKQAFDNVGNDLAPGLREEFYTLRANLLMKEGLYSQAARSLELITAEQGQQDFYYARYNLGVGYIKAGNHRQGVDILRELGKLQSDDPKLKRLRDKANLSLGFLILRRAPVIARDFLRRIRLDGQYSNRALLGLGWTEIERGHFDVALLPLRKLTQRDSIDLAVMESMLLIGQILERMRAFPQALQAYQEAISIFQQELEALDETLARLKSSKGIDTLWSDLLGHDSQFEQDRVWQENSPPSTKTYPALSDLLAGQPFHGGLKNLHDLDLLLKKLEIWQEDIPLVEHLVTQRSELFDSQLEKLGSDTALQRVIEVRANRDDFAAELERIETELDTVALANIHEQELLGKLIQLEHLITALPDRELAPEYFRRHALLKGRLIYEIEIGFDERVKLARQQLLDIDHLLEQAMLGKQSLQRVQGDVPEELARMHRGMEQKRGQIINLQSRTRAAIDEQKRELQGLIENNLLTMREKLVVYLDSARYSLAHLQDAVFLSEQVRRRSAEVSE